MTKASLIGIIAAVIFISGAGYIVYNGRPVAKLSEQTRQTAETQTQPSSNTNSQAPTESATQTASTGTYTLADVEKHNSESDCWSVVDQNVYDLSSWISRHPGGPGPIIGMCGKDGSAMYRGQHGASKRPASMLALLKIGALQQ
jgi:cytochrome b involved in lipid metabolism